MLINYYRHVMSNKYAIGSWEIVVSSWYNSAVLGGMKSNTTRHILVTMMLMKETASQDTYTQGALMIDPHWQVHTFVMSACTRFLAPTDHLIMKSKNVSKYWSRHDTFHFFSSISRTLFPPPTQSKQLYESRSKKETPVISLFCN